jgi:hypothetical protein
MIVRLSALAYTPNYRAYTLRGLRSADAIEFLVSREKLRGKIMAIKQVKGVADIPSSELDDWGPVPEPVSETVSQLRGRIINENPDGSEAGIWECTPVTWTRLVMDAEISTFVAGHALFHPENGETVDIKAGDTVYFDNNSKGTWEVLETVRKAYLTFKRD